MNDLGPWINRIGILFDLLGSFMISPELIGLDRIGRAEKRLKAELDRLRSQFRRWRALVVVGGSDNGTESGTGCLVVKVGAAVIALASCLAIWFGLRVWRPSWSRSSGQLR